MVDANLSRSGDSIENESSRKKKKRQQEPSDSNRPVSVHESSFSENTKETRSNNHRNEQSPIDRGDLMSNTNHKEVYYMEDILKEENGSTSPDIEPADLDDDRESDHDDVRFSPEKEQALQTLDEVIQAAEESMSKLNKTKPFIIIKFF